METSILIASVTIAGTWLTDGTRPRARRPRSRPTRRTTTAGRVRAGPPSVRPRCRPTGSRRPPGPSRTGPSAGTTPTSESRREPVQHHQAGHRNGQQVAATLTSGRRPNTSTLGTTTPTCAPSVTPSGSANAPSLAKRWASHGPDRAHPPVAPTDSQNPTDHSSSGSIRTSPITASANMRTGDRSRPDMNAVADNPAITPARRIDGSNRVIATNQAITPTVEQPTAATDATGPAADRTRPGRTRRSVRTPR